MEIANQAVSSSRPHSLARSHRNAYHYSMDVSRIKIFLSDILSPKSAHVNIHVKEPDCRLYVFHLKKEKSPLPHFHITEVASHSASFASPVICTRPNVQDVIIQNSTSTQLSVITSRGETYALMSRLATETSPSHIGAQILDVVDSRLTLRLSAGLTLRLDVDFNIRHSLTQQCLAALATVLSARDFFLVKTATLSHYGRISQHLWTLRDLTNVLLSVLGLLDPTETPTEHSFESPWESMLQDITVKRELHLENVLASEQNPPKAYTKGRAASCEERISSDLAPFVVQALHFVAEDRRLVANRQNDVLQLAEMILHLAAYCQFEAWIDYWMRIAPSVVLPSVTTLVRESVSIAGHL